MTFSLLSHDKQTNARLGTLTLQRATVQTPVFMPVGTQATVKSLEPEDLRELDYSLMLVNAYHLWQRPGLEVIRKFGGVHKFMNWPGAVLSDSGGFQVFSLRSLGKITEEGAKFQSHLDGSPLMLTPETSAEIQIALDSDIVMAFDECPPHPSEEKYIKEAMLRSARWTERSLRHFREHGKATNKFFGIIQGGMVAKLRQESADRICELSCDGYAIGGLSVGETKELMREVLGYTTPCLPEESPRYLMGVGTPSDILDAIAEGVDMFDCVYPTRMARHAVALTSEGKVKLKNARHKLDDSPLSPSCNCHTCKNYSRAYIHHLFRAKESTAWTLVSRHNLALYATLIEGARRAIAEGTFGEYQKAWTDWDERVAD